MRRKQQKKQERIQSIVQQIVQQLPSSTDPQGSWTGRPMEEYELPVQDADDL